MSATMHVKNSLNDQILLSLSEIRGRVAAIKGHWSDEEKAERAEVGQRRRDRLAELLVVDDCWLQ